MALLDGAIAEGESVARAVGCPACRGEGFKGRMGIYEVVAVDPGFAALIHDGASEAALLEAARAAGPSLLDDGVAKVRAGETTVEEVARVTRDEGI